MIQVLGKKIREFTQSQQRTIGAPVENFLPRTADAPLNGSRIAKAHFEYLGMRGQSSAALLDRFSFPILLLGNPGIGKSVALKECAHSKLAALHDDHEVTVELSDGSLIPIYLDLADYDGRLLDLLKASVVGLPYDELVAAGKLSFLIDSYDQCPLNMKSTLQSDLAQFLQRAGDCRVVVASCFDEDLDYFGGERFTLERGEKSFAGKILADTGIDWLRFSDAVKNTLRVPGILGEAQSGRLIQDSSNLSVTSLLTQFVEHKMGGDFAVSDLDCWLGTFAVALTERRKPKMSASGCLEFAGDLTEARSILEQLIERRLLLRHGEDHVLFLSEELQTHFASQYLAQQFENDTSVLDERIASRVWDPVWPVVIEQLSEESRQTFYSKILPMDPHLAIKLLPWMPDSENWTAECLEFLSSDDASRWATDSVFLASCEKLPVRKSHSEALKQLMKCTDGRSQVGAAPINRALGKASVTLLLEHALEHPEDFNVCQQIGGRVSALLRELDESERHVRLIEIWDRLNASTSELGSKCGGAEMLLAAAMKTAGENFVQKEYARRKPCSEFELNAIAYWAGDSRTRETIRFLISAISSHEFPLAVYPLILQAQHQDKVARCVEELDTQAQVVLLRGVEKSLEHSESAKWAVELLQKLCEQSDIVRNILDSTGSAAAGSRAAAKLVAASEFGNDLWKAIEYFLENETNDAVGIAIARGWAPLVQWSENEELFLRAIDIGDPDLALAMVYDYIFERQLQSNIKTERVESWLGWMSEAICEQDHFVGKRLPGYILWHKDDDFNDWLVEKVNTPDFPYRRLLVESFLLAYPNLSLDLLTEETVDFLIENIPNQDHIYGASVLAKIATKEFTKQRLLPLIVEQNPEFKGKLLDLVGAIEKRLECRFGV